jgi:hypothetical protein
VAALLLVCASRADAMPVFAQAYAAKCTLCHVMPPALNTYGRYIQRTGYGGLDPHTLNRALPIWWDQQVRYDNNQSPRTQVGNAAIQAVGFLGTDVTYHFQQWILQNNTAGDLDTFWLSYNNLFQRSGHLFAGLVEAPAPSPFSQWMDIAAFTTPEITVGEHTYELDANRWGTKLNYVRGSLDFEAAWLYAGGSGPSVWGASSNFSNTDKTFQYKAAYANPNSPVEAGIYGSRGSLPLAEGGYDHYWSVAPYVERDPTKGIPGVLAIYQRAYDGNAGITTLPSGAPSLLGPANSVAATLELYQPVLNQGLFSLRKEWTNDGLGTLGQTGNVDFSYPIARFLRAYVEEYFSEHTRPGWAYTIWWASPLTSVK